MGEAQAETGDRTRNWEACPLADTEGLLGARPRPPLQGTEAERSGGSSLEGRVIIIEMPHYHSLSLFQSDFHGLP